MHSRSPPIITGGKSLSSSSADVTDGVVKALCALPGVARWRFAGGVPIVEEFPHGEDRADMAAGARWAAD